LIKIFTSILNFTADKILWNGGPLTLRKESENDHLGDSENPLHYTDLPISIKTKFPLKGTTIWSKKEKNVLELFQTTIVYMLRNPQWGDWKEMMSIGGWEATGMTASLNKTHTVEIYKRFFKPGTYHLDDSSALYLFESDKSTFNITLHV
jgi:hypothetical protein